MKQLLNTIHATAPALGLLLALSCGPVSAQLKDTDNPCGNLENHYGPFDYRQHEGSKRLVEVAHFTPGVERLTLKATGPFGGDIGYTLRAFPNHYRALQTMERLVEKEKADPPESARYTIECYYERAIRFVPDDHIVRLLYANFLVKRQRRDAAMQQIDYVAETTKENPLAQLNTGRMYLELKEYDKALVMAHRLLAMGYDRKELRDGLAAAGKWVDPPSTAASESEPTKP
ncbi:MAG: ABC transporter permease [Rubrivivax sp.]|nr:MAG: ABC transporter permease [Rubrivivax sp.]